ncbi:hypothetical protein GCM10025857_19180 [Alicyclobacillus contaminans]|nr:hypothetical protein GCM10025857_19180 [Alicyclobacillus contaminans]
MSTIAPFSTWPIQTETLRPLYAALAEGRVPHAVLLAGSSEDTAELAAFITRLLLCTAPGAPCGRCWACLQGDRHPDAIRAVPDEHGVVKTAAIEQVQQRLSRTSHTGGAWSTPFPAWIC